MERSNKNTRTKMQWNFHYAQYKGQAIGRGVVETRGGVETRIRARRSGPGASPKIEDRAAMGAARATRGGRASGARAGSARLGRALCHFRL